MLPGGAKTLGIELPRAAIFITGMCERLTSHFSVRRKCHFEFSAAGRGGGEGLAVEKDRLYIARRHGLRSEGGARGEEYVCDGEWFCAH